MRLGKRDLSKIEKEHDKIRGRLRNAHELHRRRLSVMFPNRTEVLRTAKDLTWVFEEEQRLKHGSIEVFFEERGAEAGYYLKLYTDCPQAPELAKRIRQETGELFELNQVN